MQRVTPIEPFNPDPDARYLRESPGPIAEEQSLSGRWLLALLLAVVVVSCSACSSADAAQEPSASAADLKRAAASAWACPGMHAEWTDGVVFCLKEAP
ncbi:hypothetical protein [Delftia acidovorans]|uniref:hypothetical protein n=1 Tax=Delftia acidovorans TaxID=80866 RepID=UPI001EDF0346|nr:hypothetical protein [Delftia acidovorans]MCG3782741.1 hypothetical protein [Delftia acidovorans]